MEAGLEGKSEERSSSRIEPEKWTKLGSEGEEGRENWQKEGDSSDDRDCSKCWFWRATVKDWI